MKKNQLIIGGLIIAAFAVFLLFLINRKKTVTTSGTVPGNTTTEKSTQTDTEGFTGKLKQAILRNIPMKCIWKKDENFSAVGYLKSQKYYGEIINQGKKGYVILKDKCMWTWNENNKQGVKMCFEKDIWEDQKNVPQDDYYCVPGTVSDSMFNPPGDINFLDIDKQMEGLQK
ncbi:hypothetical protein A2Y99_01335 [Candidatus Gottesmanbacteria bacterium RBG_13_37_7]|uniref:Uncharacterized protein n=1 Tax=Candidatus Gottesmanbacteria bacterium RBG_13_37_7 TaxID=1798369 RepID=A0A1F5YHX6_9BACT|nr:MAG: hypothetical protein A2Y99_01335 [Candidatus Gottesmanbacteria bacterium RBG_13_37_7]